VVFTADDELYPPKEAVLPPKPLSNPDVQYLAVLREFLPVYPAQFWKKYDGRITYRMEPDSFSVYNYAAPWVLTNARSSPSFEERSGKDLALIAFVSMRCGRPDGTDGRSQRTKFVEDLQKISRGLVDSYGVCAKNIAWPEGYDRDKHHVMVRHKFCIAIDNNVDDDYVTEKLWDCLAAGAVPIYRGAKNVARYLPHGRESAIFIDDFATVADLAAHLEIVGADRTRWEAYRRWTREDPDPEWTEFMKIVDMRNVKCNLCSNLRKAYPHSTDCGVGEKPVSKVHVPPKAVDPPPTPGTPVAPKITEKVLPVTKDVAPPTPPPPAKGASVVPPNAKGKAPKAEVPKSKGIPVRQWSVDDVAAWLKEHAFSSEIFRQNFVDGKLLVELDDEMLRDDLSLASKLQRKRLLMAIAELL
jgi:hypothetical protein